MRSSICFLVTAIPPCTLARIVAWLAKSGPPYFPERPFSCNNLRPAARIGTSSSVRRMNRRGRRRRWWDEGGTRMEPGAADRRGPFSIPERALIVRPLSALPTSETPVLRFSATGAGLHAEGFVVEFTLGHSSWNGNFARGVSQIDTVTHHHDCRDALVIAGGTAYVVDPAAQAIRCHFGGTIVDMFTHPTRRWLIINNQNIAFSALGPDGEVWRSRRISWDGLRAMSLNGDVLEGEAWDAMSKTWVPFALNLENGMVVGGSAPPEPEPSRAERLKTLTPQLIADVVLYPTSEGGRKSPAFPGGAAPAQSPSLNRSWAMVDGRCSEILRSNRANGAAWDLCSSRVKRRLR